MSSPDEPKIEIPDEFSKLITDFITDITNTFPEYGPIINKWWTVDDSINTVFKHCVQVFPDRFFDILYQNEEMFSKESDVNTEFLPGLSFKYMWQCDISTKTKETIWKYLQLILISIVGCVKDRNTLFGDTSKLFESINEDEFKGKLEETLEKMQTLFERPSSNTTAAVAVATVATEDPPVLSELPQMQDHIAGMLNGKLGELAREIAEETAGDMDISMENMTDIKDVFQSLFKNPGKLMGLVKNVGDKLDSRIKSGDINQNELITEASEMMAKMKNMPGMDNIQGMLSKMGMGSGGGGGGGMGDMMNMMNNMMGNGTTNNNNSKLDTTKMERNMKAAQTKERMKKKMEAKHVAEMISKAKNAAMPASGSTASATVPATVPVPLMTDDELVAFFSECDRAEKTPRNANRNNASIAITGTSPSITITAPTTNPIINSVVSSGDKKKKKKK